MTPVQVEQGCSSICPQSLLGLYATMPVSS